MAHVIEHRAEVESYRVPIRTKTGRVKSYRTRHLVRCSCGQHLGTSLDYFDARRVWREHKASLAAERRTET